MTNIREVITDTCSEICDNFCKFSNTGSNGKCAWCQLHDDKCPSDSLIKAAEEIDGETGDGK